LLVPEYIEYVKENTQARLPQAIGRLALCLLSLGFAFPEQASAATVTYVGTVSSTGANNYEVHHWSLASVAKQYDFDGNNRYGSAGYYQIRPMPTGSGGNVFESAGNGNLLGTDAGSNATVYSKPSFIGSITGKAGTFVNFNGYSNFVEPNSANAQRMGALSVSLPNSNGPYDTPSGPNTGYFGNIFEFTVSAPTVFRIGITVDAVGGGYAPDYVGIYNNTTGTVNSTLLTRDAQPDMAIFEINALAGETYTAALWRVAGNPDTTAAFSMVTFDTIPEPSTGLLLLVGIGCLAVRSRRRL
jgi:hypothetical protein